MSEEINEQEEHDEEMNHQSDSVETITKVTGMYKEWFLDYASYVILERAVPSIEDGFKPVQRRIMHSMKDLDDGRYNKVANIVGHTMQYHPHGDASIADAMVQMGQKDLLIDMQGNWGNILTGDRAAASRYIEARLSKFALEVVFNPKTTEWKMSYDGRKKEPVDLPVKFPLLLAQGAEGIAVGLSTKILPHNFNELIEASIKYLKGRSFTIFPDFQTGGIADFTNYNDGKRGGKVRVRAKISQIDKKTLAITEIPFATTTSSLIDSILKANEKGKIRIKRIEDNTAANVEILVHLPPNVSPDKTIDALYAFTSCENSISPLCCIIEDNKPLFIGVTEMLKHSTDNTVELLKKELEIQLYELEEQWHFASLERIFIENRIYRDIEEEETWEGVIQAIDKGLAPHITHLKREVTEEDITRLTEIRIKKISKFDIDKAKQHIESLEEKIAEVKHHLEHLIEFAIDYFKNLKSTYGKGRERKTEIRIFDDIVATKVVMRNTKLYVNKEEGFIGTSLKKDAYVTDCADIDDVIIFKSNGTMLVTKVASKTFVGKGIIHIAIFKKKDKRTVYNMIYKDGKNGPSYMKRFNVTSITRDKEYDLTNGNKGSAILYFTANPNGEAEVVSINLRAVGSIKKLKWDIDFADLAIKGRGVRGNLVTKYAVKKIEFKSEGVSTLKPRKIWFDEAVQRLNVDGRGTLLGEFRAEDKLLIATQSGKIKAVKPDLAMHFEQDMIVLEKWEPNKPISAIYFDGDKARYYIKRFLVEITEKEETFISDHEKSQLEIIATDYRPMVEVVFSKRSLEKMNVNIEEFIAVKGIKALGNQLTKEKIRQVNILDPLPFEVPKEAVKDNIEAKKEVIEDKLPLEVAPIEKRAVESKEEKVRRALERAIQKKKIKREEREDNQETLF
ncbi:DNA gyrase/topoisomerase IV subunit A [Tenacibaculum maritimum]|uniref:DNA gyrase/topoisomerase IV subunit A n=1 Tax=Tenacibaculum maritimum TaxID=107401 RepID=UPI00042910C3|nr:DNA gyrase/topoisomerase IV subunit A [Tenacibaculum maritimum]MCD9585636.1 DNA gyrase/topoisomerase IV subunit A [Tenacibaculum maritimum]MCD9609548.1 DNA gyrase/topoisomerase IV subunit A [Tenacibaculum maritimum]MCD9621492.1 DNA gyrase/topoisomerase IV subunit A [Tenacibaculum maritimum]MCD9627738.1 DNA gyrase/topoisomerase IV subunit A [Tenacibaculum maritimum]MCD9630239.1 DNA gyrase/topoisomerase IV subunit A [Tenacibaculum maritimum]